MPCAPWKRGSSTSDACMNANINLVGGIVYNTPDGQFKITSTLIDSIKKELWGNPVLQDYPSDKPGKKSKSKPKN